MFKNSLILTSGTIISQLIGFAFALLLARVYSSVEFGIFTVFLSISTMLSTISVAAYDKAIMFSNNRSQAISISSFIISLTITMSIIIILLLIILDFLFEISLSYEIMNFNYLGTIFFGIILTSLSQVFLFYSLKRDRLGLIAGTKVGQSVTTGGSQLGFSYIFNSAGLIIGYLAGLTINAIMLLFLLSKDGLRRRDFNRRRLAATARRFNAYPRYTLPNELIDTASTQLQLLLISAFFSVGTLGQFAFGQRILSAPAAVIGQAIGQAFFHAIRHRASENNAIMLIMLRTWVALFAIGLVPFTVLMLYGTEIFVIIFGAGWSEAGTMAAYCAPLLFVRFVSSPTSSIYLHLQMQKTHLMFVIAGFIYRTGSVLLYFLGFDIYQVIIFHSIIEIIFIIIYNVIPFRRMSNGA
jgi:O-antigen/teichoic acid export membrane protein